MTLLTQFLGLKSFTAKKILTPNGGNRMLTRGGNNSNGELFINASHNVWLLMFNVSWTSYVRAHVHMHVWYSDCKVNILQLKRLYLLKEMLYYYNYCTSLFKAHILPFSVTFPHMPQHFTHTSAVWKTQTQHFAFKKKSRGAMAQKYFESVVSIHQVFLVFIWIHP